MRSNTRLDLLTLHGDVQFRIFCELEVHDILRAERTFKHLRDIIATRHLWIIKLDDLSQTCAPVLPPYVDVAELTDEQLREIVIRAFRTYWQMMDGSSSTISYALVKTIVPSRPEDISDGQKYHISSVQLSPCERFLFMLYWAYERRGIRIHDLLNGDRCIWAAGFDASEVHVWFPQVGNGNTDEMVFDFETCGDGSITLLLYVRFLLEEAAKSITKLFRLVPDDSKGESLREASSVEYERTDDDGISEACCALSGRFAVVGIFLPPQFIVMDWIEKQTIVISDARTFLPISIWQDFLFYGDYDENGPICALDVSCFGPVVPECGTTTFANTRYALYKYPRRCDVPYLVVLMVTKSPSSDNPGPFFAAIRAIFDTSRPPDRRWTQISSTLPTRYISENNVVGTRMRFRTYLSLSGQVLVSGRLESPGRDVVEKETAMLIVNRRGELVFPELSRNLTTTALAESSDTGILQSYTEVHSGVVIKRTHGKYEQNHIEIYTPVSD